MTSTDFYAKLTSINFIVKNISPQRKKITVFNYPLEFGQSRDLFTIPEISEDNIRSSLVKGELANKIRAGDIKIMSSSINLLQFDAEQKAFIDSALQSPSTTPGVDPATIGGGGGTVIQDGGTIGGVYEGNVLCLGEVTVSDHLEVKGSLTVRGDFINDSGYEVIVRNDLFAQNIYFDRANTSIPQSNFTVDGDLFFTYMEFRQCGGTAALLRVGGNLIGSFGYSGSPIIGNGEFDGTPGLNILVYGNMNVSFVEINGYSDTGFSSGNGGVCEVYGNMNIENYFSASGGDGNPGYNAGYGGYLEVYGDLSAGYAYISLNGGEGNQSSAGNGGSFYVAGNATVDELYVYGGYCNSDIEDHRSGTGGEISIDGNLVINDYISVNGGNREGDVPAPGYQFPPNGGYVNVGGDFIIDGDFAGFGGNVFTNANAPHNGGNGASIYVYGSIVCSDDFRAYGGYSDYSSGGNGGYLQVEGSIHVDDELEFYGGYGDKGNGGNGGTLRAHSNADIGYIDFSGGFANDGNGGYGGDIEIDGMLILQDYAYLNGGNCTSDDETYTASNGGYMYCYGITSYDIDVELYGGSRFGATTVPSPSNSSGNGGDFDCYGPAMVNVYADGGGTYTDSPNSPGGGGGDINIYGPLHSGTISNRGGNVVGVSGPDGGSGGNIYIEGPASINSVYSNGGSSDTANGAGGIITFKNGATVNYLNIKDGIGSGSNPSFNTKVVLSGTCNFGTIEMSDRLQCWIHNNTAIPATLKVFNMPTKKTLNNITGTATADISSNLQDSIFFTGASSTWYKVSGTTV